MAFSLALFAELFFWCVVPIRIAMAALHASVDAPDGSSFTRFGFKSPELDILLFFNIIFMHLPLEMNV